jgi:Inner membrane protein YgaP-like, transmembrane domain
MTKNMGRLDRTVRLVLALFFIFLVIVKTVEGTVAIVLIILAAILVLTTLLGFCPLYVPLGASTKRNEKKGETPRTDA